MTAKRCNAGNQIRKDGERKSDGSESSLEVFEKDSGTGK
jgi:hypothetical protein